MALVGIPLLVIFYQLWLCSAQTLETSPPSPVYAAVHTKLVLNCSTFNKSDSIRWQWTSSMGHNSYSTTNNSSMTSLVIDRVNYSDGGVYVCRAVNQTSGLVVAQTSITVSVGDPPPRPPSPTLKHACGYPPTEFIMSYQYTTPDTTHLPLTVELIIGSLKTCLFGGNDFKVVEDSRRVIRRPGKSSFEVDIADVIKEIRPNFPYCNDSVFDCTTFCTCTRAKNVFGQSISKTTKTRIEEKCSEVADFRAIDVRRNSLTLGWGLPKCLRNSKQWYIKVNYWIWCKPTCGQIIKITRDVDVITGLNYTIKSLIPYTNYTLYASCSFTMDPEDAGKQISISVQTKEDTPRAPPVIETLRWLSEPVVCTEPNGTAVFSWKVNKDSLLGKVRYYIITYQAANSSSKTTRKVPAGVHRLVVSGLQVDKSYRFSATVCTGGGCSNPRHHSLSSFLCTTSDKPSERSNSYPYWIWIVIGACPLVLFFMMMVGYAFKKRGRVDLQRPVLPTSGIYPTAVVYPHHQEPIDSDYARAYGPAFFEGIPQELGISTTCLSRSSSVLTCSTET